MEYKNIVEIDKENERESWRSDVPFTSELKSKVFEHLKSMNVSHVKVAFTGGHDSGCIDEITLYNKANENDGVELQEEDFKNLYAYLSSPVYEEYGSFAFDFSTSGTVTWYVTPNKDGHSEVVVLEAEQESTEFIDKEL
jgi:hypothetical protein